MSKKGIRFLLYFVGLFILALGLTLNTKANLGVSPIISIPYSISQLTRYNFGDLTLKPDIILKNQIIDTKYKRIKKAFFNYKVGFCEFLLYLCWAKNLRR